MEGYINMSLYSDLNDVLESAKMVLLTLPSNVTLEALLDASSCTEDEIEAFCRGKEETEVRALDYYEGIMALSSLRM